VAKDLNYSIQPREEEMKKITIVMPLACVLLTGVVRIEGQDPHPILDQVANKFATEKATLLQDSATPQSEPQLEPKAIEIIKAACALLAAARSIEAGTIASYFNRSSLQY
jgi:hypothetical protein